MTVPISPTESVTMAHVRLAISPARSPAFTDSKTMTRFRGGYRVRVVKARRSRMLSSDRIFACLPSINKLIVVMMAYCESNARKMQTPFLVTMANPTCEERRKTSQVRVDSHQAICYQTDAAPVRVMINENFWCRCASRTFKLQRSHVSEGGLGSH